MDAAPNAITCFVVSKDPRGQVSAAVERRSSAELGEGNVVVRVAYSSLNYKDALAVTGHPGVTRRFPHVPGIDAAGTVVESQDPRFRAGDEVLATGYDLGVGHWGGYAEYIRVPADWIVPRPAGLSARESMILGTAGFTAAQATAALIEHGVAAEQGDVVVTGAGGGVGSLAVAILSKLGYAVTAATGKESAHDFLRGLGARKIISRKEVDDSSGKPLLTTRWAAAVDTAGGNILSTIVRSLEHRGCAAACGLTGGVELSLTVYPFILRGVSLLGIDSAMCPMERRLWIWSQLAGPWRPDGLERIGSEIAWGELNHYVGEILAGRVQGRVVVRPAVS